MADNISRVNGRDEMVYTGETPWHGKGTYSAEMLTAADAVRIAMPWTVSTRPVFLADQTEVKGFKAIVRDDTRVTLGMGTDRYHVIQNTQAAQIVDAVVTEGQAKIETAGVLGNGERCWMLANIPGDYVIDEARMRDNVKMYFLLAWGHDGKHGVAGKLTPVRVVCENTLGAAGFAHGTKWSVAADIYLRHSANAKIQIEEARKALGLMKKQADATAELYRAMAATRTADETVAQYFSDVFPAPERVTDPAAPEADTDYQERLAKWTAHQETLAALYTSGKGAEFSRGTLWGAYNAVTEWTDHVYPVLANGSVSAVRQQSVLFGAYADVKRRALAEAFDVVA